MSLKISDATRKIFRIVGVVLLVFVVICFVRVAIWEHFYYSEREGSPRTASALPFSEQEEVVVEADETEVTEVIKQEYIVAPDKPRYLSIDKLGISNARILEVSADPGKPMGVPGGIFDVGWARTSDKPGEEPGTLLMDGHNGGPTKAGIFKRLGSLQAGDIITIERGDGQIFRYEVYDSKNLKVAEADTYMKTLQKSPVPGRESLSLITCTGEWIQARRTYDSRVMLRAVLMQ